MSDNPMNEVELSKLKLSELKKLCKKHGLTSSGSKVELVARLLEGKNENFTILQPGDEAKLLGDDLDEDSNHANSFNLTGSGLLTDTLDKDSVDRLIDTPELRDDSPPSLSLETSTEMKSPGKASKRPLEANAITDKETESTSNKVVILEEQPVDTLMDTDETETKVEVGLLSEKDRLSVRADRFGLDRTSGPSIGSALSDDRLVARARRFGLPVGASRGSTGANAVASDSSSDANEKQRKRAERFGSITTGTTVNTDTVNSPPEESRRADRLKRFSNTTELPDVKLNGLVSDQSDEAVRAARATKFGIQTDADRMQKRKARFGLA